MSGRISAICAQKKRKDRVNIYIDGRYHFSLSLWAAAGLNAGDSLSSEQIRNLKALDEKEKAWQRAADYLARRPRSAMEIRQYLEGKGFSRRSVEQVMERLTAYGYIDDAAFARMWIESRLRLRPRGAFGLSRELKQKGISEEIIEAALTDFDEHAAAKKAISPKLDQWAALPEIKRRRKIYDFLARRGFDRQTCRDIWEETKD